MTLLQLSARSGTAAGGTVKFTNANAKAHTQLCHPGAAAQLGWGKEQAGQRKLITAIEETIAADVSSSGGGGGAAAKSLAKKLLPFSPKRQHPGTVAEQRAAQMQYYIFTGQPKSMFQNGYFTSMMETCNPAAALVKYTDVPALTHAMFAVFVFLIQLVVTESVKFFGGAQCMMAGHDAVTIQGVSYQCMFLTLVWRFQKYHVFFSFKPTPSKTDAAVALVIAFLIYHLTGMQAINLLYVTNAPIHFIFC